MYEPIHQYEFTLINEDLKKRRRVIRSILSKSDIATFVEEGFLLLPDLIPGEAIEIYRQAVDDIRTQKYGRSTDSTYRSPSFAGQYLREPHLYDRRFWPLLERAPIIDAVRSILGPRLVLRSFSARVTLPGTCAGTKWHRDQRSLVSPAPALFTEPHVVTCLIYLDDVDESCGQTFVMARTHRSVEEPREESLFASLPGEIAFSPRAGSVLLLHSAMWHRGGPNNQEGKMRRLLIQQLAPAWARVSEFEAPPDNGLRFELLAAAHDAGDEEMLEILGEGGYM